MQGYKEALVFKNENEALEALNAVPRGNYFLCTCPDCEKDEAFMYKNNTKFVQCNRENECGERNYIQYRERLDEKDLKYRKMQEIYPDLSVDQVQALDWMNRAMYHIQYYVNSPTLDDEHGYRGISRDVSQEFVADMVDEKLVGFMFEKIEPLLEKDYSKSSNMRKRNLVIPIKGEDNSIERVLLRSSLDKDIQPKEVQLIVNPSKKARDFFIDVPEQAERVVISEAILDGLSLKEVDRDVGVMALTGSNKTRNVIDYLKVNKEKFQDKEILVAMDDDDAGEKATEQILDAMEQYNIGKDVYTFQYNNRSAEQGITDPNDFLEKDRWGLVEAYQNSFDEKAIERQSGVNHERKKEVSVER